MEVQTFLTLTSPVLERAWWHSTEKTRTKKTSNREKSDCGRDQSKGKIRNEKKMVKEGRKEGMEKEKEKEKTNRVKIVVKLCNGDTEREWQEERRIHTATNVETVKLSWENQRKKESEKKAFSNFREKATKNLNLLSQLRLFLFFSFGTFSSFTAANSMILH